MSTLKEYHRPATLADAVALLERHGAAAALLAGGSTLLADLALGLRPEVDAVVDISRLGLGHIRATETHLILGATATLTDVLGNEAAVALAGGLLAQAARNEGPVNLRNAATVGGIVAGANSDSEFYAALLALGARAVTTAAHEPQPLASFVAGRGIITAVQVALEPVRAGLARVARTPADRPLVAAIAVVGSAGTRIAYCGLAARPVLEGDDASPYSDFNGSAEYRAAMAQVLCARAIAQAK